MGLLFCNGNYKLEHFSIFNQETDYILSYFDNGEEYGNDDDDADEGPVYWRTYRARGININTFCKKTEKYARKLRNYSSKEGTSMFLQGRKLFSQFLNKVENFRFTISIQGLNGG